MHKGKGEDIHKRMWITSCGYTLENVNFPGWGNSLKCKFPHMRIYSYYCEFPLVEVHPKMCNSAVWIFTNSVNYRMRRYTVPCEFPHEEKCITPCGYTREKVYFPRWGNSPNFDFPHMRIYTYNCEFPLVEMHPKMYISAVRIYIFFGVLPHAEIHSLMWMSTWGKVYFHGCGFAQF